MTIRKPKDVLLGGQPRATSAPAGAPSETRFLGRREGISAETINRGVYSVAEQVDLLFSDLLALSRKAVTKAEQKPFDIVVPVNLFEQAADDVTPVNAYVGILPEESPTRVVDFLQPGTPSTYTQTTMAAYTVLQSSAGKLVYVDGVPQLDFQLRTMPGFTGELKIRFVSGPATNISYAEPDLVITYVSGVDTFADVAAAIIATPSVFPDVATAYGSETVIIDDNSPFNPALGASIPVVGSGSVDAQPLGVYIDDPITATDLYLPLPKAAVTYAAGTFTLLTDLPRAVKVGDHVIVGVNSPTIIINEDGLGGNQARATGRYAKVVVTAVTGVGDTAGDTFDIDSSTFTLLSELGYSDNQVVLLASFIDASYWAIGHTHYYDRVLVGEKNPLPFSFGEADNVHWVQATNGIPFVGYNTSSTDIMRIANFKSLLAETGTITAPNEFTDIRLNAESVPTGIALGDGGTQYLNVLVQPKYAGSGASFPKTSLADLRFVMNAPLPTTTQVVIRRSSSPDSSAAFSLLNADNLTTVLEYVETVGGKPVYRLDPFVVTNGAGAPAELFSNSTTFFYCLEIRGNASTKLERIYFQGTNSASPVFRFMPDLPLAPGQSRTFSLTDIEIWIVHESGDPYVGLTGLTLDLYQSSTGEAGSFTKIAKDIALEMSHVVSTGPRDRIYAYRAQVFPEGYDISVDSELLKMFVLAHVKQPGDANTHRRVVNGLFVSAHRNSSDQLGSFVGANMCGVSLNPDTLKMVDISAGSEVYSSTSGSVSGATFTDTTANFGLVVAGDWLNIRSGTNAGNYRISAVPNTNELTLELGNIVLSTESNIEYRVYMGGNPVFPAGVEGGSTRFLVAANVDIEGVAGTVDLGVGSYAQFRDLPPDGLRTTAGAFGDAGALSAKIEEIMGLPISTPIPPGMSLVELDGRITALNTVTVGLGTLNPLSYGQFNVSASVDASEAIANALAALPEGGVVLFKPGVYGDGVSSANNVFSENIRIPENVTFKAEAPGSVVLDFANTGYGIDLDASKTRLDGFILMSTAASAVTIAPTANVQDVALTNLGFTGNTRILIGNGDGSGTGNIYRLLIEKVNFDITGGTCIESVYTTGTVGGTGSVDWLVMRDVQGFATEFSTKKIEVHNVHNAVLQNVRASLSVKWCSYVNGSRLHICNGEAEGIVKSSFDGLKVVTNGAASGIEFSGNNSYLSVSNVHGTLTGGTANSNFGLVRFEGGLSYSFISDITGAMRVATSESAPIVKMDASCDHTVVSGIVTDSNCCFSSTGASLTRVAVHGLSAAGYDSGTQSTRAVLEVDGGASSGCVFSDIVVNSAYAGSQNAVLLYGVSDSVLRGVQAKNGNVALNTCTDVLLSDIVLGTGAISEVSCTRIRKIGTLTSSTSFIEIPSGKSITAGDSPSLGDGGELIKIGDSPTTFRIWKLGEYTYTCTNVKDLSVSGTKLSVTQEDISYHSTIMIAGNGKTLLRSVPPSGTSLDLVFGDGRNVNKTSDPAPITDFSDTRVFFSRRSQTYNRVYADFVHRDASGNEQLNMRIQTGGGGDVYPFAFYPRHPNGKFGPELGYNKNEKQWSVGGLPLARVRAHAKLNVDQQTLGTSYANLSGLSFNYTSGEASSILVMVSVWLGSLVDSDVEVNLRVIGDPSYSFWMTLVRGEKRETMSANFLINGTASTGTKVVQASATAASSVVVYDATMTVIYI